MQEAFRGTTACNAVSAAGNDHGGARYRATAATTSTSTPSASGSTAASACTATTTSSKPLRRSESDGQGSTRQPPNNVKVQRENRHERQVSARQCRKEDFRFITGKGQYTDDVIRPGETRAVFVRSPHAHAKIKSIEVSAAKKMPGLIDVLTGKELAADKIGNLICGWMIHSKDGSPMKMAPHPALAADKVCHVGDAVAVVIAATQAQARDAAEKVKVDYEVLPAVVDPAKAKSGPQIHGGAEEHHLRMVAGRR
jgi:xanthine dehydrogenase molybdopterin-binding subunit B